MFPSCGVLDSAKQEEIPLSLSLAAHKCVSITLTQKVTVQSFMMCLSQQLSLFGLHTMLLCDTGRKEELKLYFAGLVEMTEL